jgi:HEPN domain-containing protein
MKERTRSLFELAEADLKVANDNIDALPHIAAFHAQQCAEKALKAMVWELSDAVDEDELRARIKHDSIRAVTKVLTQAIKESMRRSDLSSIERRLRKQKDTANGRLALLLYLAGMTSIDNIFQLFETMPFSKSQDYWGKSLDANLKPDPTFNKEWMAQLEKADEFSTILTNFFMSTMDGNSTTSLGDGNTTDRAKWAQQWLEKRSEDFTSKGLKSEAESAKRALREFERLAGTDSPFIDWMKLVIFWTPYLDAHAVRSRYVPSNEMKKYLKHRNGVRNLVAVSKQVLEQSRSVLVAFTD